MKETTTASKWNVRYEEWTDELSHDEMRRYLPENVRASIEKVAELSTEHQFDVGIVAHLLEISLNMAGETRFWIYRGGSHVALMLHPQDRKSRYSSRFLVLTNQD